MKFEEVAKQLGTTVTKVKKLVAKHLGDIKELAPEHIERLKELLEDSSELATLPPAKRLQEIEEIRAIDAQAASEIESTIQIIGIQTLKRSSNLIKQLAVAHLIQTKQAIDTVASTIEDYAIQRINQAYVNAAKNLHAVRSEFSIDDFKSQISDTISDECKQYELTKEDLELLEIVVELED